MFVMVPVEHVLVLPVCNIPTGTGNSCRIPASAPIIDYYTSIIGLPVPA